MIPFLAGLERKDVLIRKDLAGLTFARWTLETGRRQVPSLRLERRIFAGRRGGNPAGFGLHFRRWLGAVQRFRLSGFWFAHRRSWP